MDEYWFNYIAEHISIKGNALTAVKDAVLHGADRRHAIRKHRTTMALFNTCLREFRELEKKAEKGLL